MAASTSILGAAAVWPLGAQTAPYTQQLVCDTLVHTVTFYTVMNIVVLLELREHKVTVTRI
jgi:hypothetical protein